MTACTRSYVAETLDKAVLHTHKPLDRIACPSPQEYAALSQKCVAIEAARSKHHFAYYVYCVTVGCSTVPGAARNWRVWPS